MVGKESMTDIAYEIMKENPKEVLFYDLWEQVLAKLEVESQEEIDLLISFFYTNITIDGRFVNVGDNKWDLRERVPYEKVHIDMNDIYQDDEDEDDEYSLDEKDEDDPDKDNENDMYNPEDDGETEKPKKYDDVYVDASDADDDNE